MVYSTAKEVYQKLNAATKGDEDAEMLYRDLVKLAVDYARRRTDCCTVNTPNSHNTKTQMLYSSAFPRLWITQKRGLCSHNKCA
jgi:hypothetical protein